MNHPPILDVISGIPFIAVSMIVMSTPKYIAIRWTMPVVYNSVIEIAALRMLPPGSDPSRLQIAQEVTSIALRLNHINWYDEIKR